MRQTSRGLSGQRMLQALLVILLAAWSDVQDVDFPLQLV
jgi:hypothetical protein